MQELQIFIEIILLIGAVYLAFFKSYLTEKGKSAALKEDLADLTREVELVKQEFSKEQEILKKDLQRALSQEISYQDEARNAIINFHTMISEWLYALLEISPGDYNRGNVEELAEKRKLIASYYAKTGIAKSRFELIVDDKDLLEGQGELFKRILKFYHWCTMELLKILQNYESQKSQVERFLIVLKDFENNKELAEEMAKEGDKLDEAGREMSTEFYKKRTEQYMGVVSVESEFKDKIKEYLKK